MPPSPLAPAPSTRRLSWGLVVIGGLGFVVAAALFVPWHWVPGGHLVSVSARDVFTPTQIDRAESYSAVQRHLGWASYAVSLVVALVLGLTSWGSRLVRRLPGWWWVKVVLGTFALLLIGRLVTLPFALWSRSVEMEHDLSHQSLGGWLSDAAISLGVSTAFTAIGMLVVIALARRLPRMWPFWAALLSGVLVVLGSFVYPVAVEPLFNKFTSMPDGTLRTAIFQLAKTEHVHIDDVLVADASRRTTTLNAYVSGFGNTRRVVVYDNLVDDLDRPQVEVVVAHELGHAKNDDVLLGTVLGAVGSIAGIGLLGVLLSDRRLRRRAGISGPEDPGALALLLALAAVGALLASPIQNTISRGIEARADRASLEATHQPNQFIEMQRQLALHSLSDPTPPRWSQFWFGSHPTTLQRIGIAKALEDK